MDWLLYGTGIGVVIVAICIAVSTTHVMPQTSTTFSMQPIIDLTKFMKDYDDESLDTMANYAMSTFKKTNHLHPVGSHKFSVGCYGPKVPVLDITKDWRQTQSELSAMQVAQGTVSSISVCTCIDKHVEIAFGNTEFPSLSQGIFTPQTLKIINQDLIYNTSRSAGNVPFLLTDQSQFERLTDIRKWCTKAASPVYTMHIGAVYNSRLMLLVGICLIIVGLDLLEARRFSCVQPEHSRLDMRWALDLVPLFIFLVVLARWQYDTDLRDKDMQPSFLIVFMLVLTGITVAVIIFFSIYANAYHRRQQMYNPIWERVFVDVPMIVGLAMVGLALKLQNDEHDEVVLLTTVFLLLAGGFVQHISNLVKEVYDIICMRFETKLLMALQAGNPHVHDSSDANKLIRTRTIMQHFGWTRVYSFFVVLFASVASWTLSSTTSNNHNPLQFFTQNQYVYFIIAYVVALSGLDMLYEAIPFVTEKDTTYGEDAANRMRKLIICVYVIFLLGSQYSLENSES